MAIPLQPNTLSINKAAIRANFFQFCSSYYGFLLQEDAVQQKPCGGLFDKKVKICKKRNHPKQSDESNFAMGYVNETAKYWQKKTLLITSAPCLSMNALLGMYLRISELVADERFCSRHGPRLH